MTPRIVTAIVLLITVSGCGDGVGPASPSLPTPTVSSPAPKPEPVAPIPSSTLSGRIFQITAAGEQPVEDVLVEVYSCSKADNCRTSVIRRSTSNKEGIYQLPELYSGGDNYIWITKEGYQPEANPPKPTCDYCNLIVTVEQETRLDIELVRL
jgi:hypothetical protein